MKLTPRFSDALTFAFQIHCGQVRKGTRTPYISHLLSVAGLVLEYGGTEDEAIAAILHDAVEDSGITVRDIRGRYGSEVAEIVRGCTDSFEKNPSKKKPWPERKKKYLRHLKKATPPVLLVSAADKLHNARAILSDYRKSGSRLWTRFHADRDQILWYYESLVGIYIDRGEHRHLVAELNRVVQTLKQEIAREKS
jgi:(p)ppGpp synthase/HD superfamily hydrolase